MEKDLVFQRDRYLTFAFAAADILVELTEDGRIAFIAGSVRSLAGAEADAILGRSFESLFRSEESMIVRTMSEKLRAAGRMHDRILTLAIDGRPTFPVSVSGMVNHARSSILQFAIRRLPLEFQVLRAAARSAPLDRKEFAEVALRFANAALETGDVVKLSLFQFDWERLKNSTNEAERVKLCDAVLETLKGWSVQGGPVGDFGNGQYSVLIEQEIDAEVLSSDLLRVGKDQAPDADLGIDQTILTTDEIFTGEDINLMIDASLPPVPTRRKPVLKVNSISKKKRGCLDSAVVWE